MMVRLWRTAAGALTVLTALVLASCPNVLMDQIKAKISSDTGKDINSFSFMAASNALLYTDVHAIVNDTARTIALTVPKWVPLTNLVASFQFQGASVTVNGVAQASGATPHDFTAPLTYTVTPASGTPISYTVTAVTGTQGLMGGVIQGTPLALSGAVTTVAGQASSFGNPQGIVYISPYLYVADSQYSVIWRVSPSSGSATVFAGSLGNPGFLDGTGTGAQLNQPTGLATDGTNLYVADTLNNRIRMIDLTGVVTTIAGSGAFAHLDGIGTAAKIPAPTALYYDASTTTLYMTDRANLFTGGAIAPSVRAITLTAGPTYGTVATMGTYPYTTITLEEPAGIVLYNGTLYFTDLFNHAIYSGTVAAFAPVVFSGSPGTAGWVDGTGGPTGSAKFDGPTGIILDVISSVAHLFVADSVNDSIRDVNPSDGSASTYLGIGTQPGYVDTSGATNMMFDTPNGLVVVSGSPSNMYITEAGNLTVRDVKLSTTPFSSTLAGVGPGSANGTGITARFDSPRQMASNGSTLWISDQVNELVRSVNEASGAVGTLAGSLGVAVEQNGTGGGAKFDSPAGVTTDGKALYVCDQFGNTIRKIDITTGVTTTIAGGNSGWLDANGTSARFNRPAGITTDGTNLYVTDLFNNDIRQISLSSPFTVSTIAGSLSQTPGDADGTGNAATFNNPNSITTDGTNLFVSEGNNNKIRQIVIATKVVSTLAGPPTGGYPNSNPAGYVNASGTSARFRNPIGITTDGTNVYVADLGNDVIRQIVIATGAVTTVAGAAPPPAPPPTIIGQAGEIDLTGSAARFDTPIGITTDGVGLYVTDRQSNVIRRIR
jgi:hypothetical protein